LYPALIVAAMVTVCADAPASMGPVSLSGLTNNADLIIYGRVDSLATEERLIAADSSSEMRGRVLHETHATVATIEVVKGPVPGPVVVVTTVPGMEDHPVFRTGEQSILFLVRNEGAETFSTVALSQGKFDVADGQVIREGVSVQEFLNRIRDHLRPNPPEIPDVH